MRLVYVVCGVPGSGKTWACSQVADKFEYVQNDQHMGRVAEVVIARSKIDDGKPILVDCPFAERSLREQLEKAGVPLKFFFIIEPPNVVRDRYQSREKKPPTQAILTRASSILGRAKEWNAPYGTSVEILERLRQV